MSEAKHPHRATIYLNSPSLALRFPYRHLLAAFAILTAIAIAQLNWAVHTSQKEQWAGLESQLLTTGQQTSLSNIALSSIPDRIPAVPAQQTPEWLNQEVKNGDTLSLIFKRAGYNDQDVQDVISQSKDGKSLQHLFPGQTIAFRTDESGRLSEVQHIKSPLETVTYLRTEGGFESQVALRTPEAREAWTTGVITSSLFPAGQEAGLSQTMILEMANIFSGVIDFALDLHRGDTMQLVYEENYLDDKKISDGDIIAASFTNQGETFNAFRYTDSNGNTDYYNEDGVSLRKTFLMAPLDITHVSSDFNMHRMHPIYKVARPHLGTDYAAPTGTPVYAAGDGRVVQAGFNGTMGNFVVIQHNNQYTTKYLHLQKRLVESGQRVSQHQVIGAVGSTGAATGPHLHYEFLVNGVHHNPRTIYEDLPKANVLPAKELAKFQRAINKANFQLAVLRSSNHMAMNENVDAKSAPN